MKYLSQNFHQASKNLYSEDVDRKFDPSSWPEQWRTTYIKTYDRFEQIKLPPAQEVSSSLSWIIKNRKSERFADSKKINVQTISDTLYHSCAEIDHEALENRGRRAVASAGARYFIETYILIMKEVGGLKTGLYHYRVDLHTLECMYDFCIDKTELERMFTYNFSQDATVAIFLTAVFDRTQDKYKERGYRFILLEAGAIGQAIQNCAVALGINSYTLGGCFDENVEHLLDIDGVTESLVNCVLLR